MKNLFVTDFNARPHRSAYMALLDLHVWYDKISESIDQKKYIVGILIDFQKAFDTVTVDLLH